MAIKVPISSKLGQILHCATELMKGIKLAILDRNTDIIPTASTIIWVMAAKPNGQLQNLQKCFLMHFHYLVSVSQMRTKKWLQFYNSQLFSYSR